MNVITIARPRRRMQNVKSDAEGGQNEMSENEQSHKGRRRRRSDCEETLERELEETGCERSGQMHAGLMGSDRQ